MLRHVPFDLDDTLYDPDSGLWDAISARISQYMLERLALPPDEVPGLRRRYAQAFGTTLTGLRRDFAVDPADYLAYVHDLPLADYLRPNPALSGMLARLPLDKAIFTNADRAHAERVTDQLGVRAHFGHVVDIWALDLVSKPDPAAYQRALEITGARAAECVLVEDSLRNLLPARSLGMLTVLVNRRPAEPGQVDYQITSLPQLERVLAGLIGQKW